MFEADTNAGESIASSPATPHRGKGITMSRREQLLNLLVARTTASRDRLQRMSTDELEEALSKSLLAGIRKEAENSPAILARQQEIAEINAERLWDRFFFKHSEISDNLANRKLLFNYALSLSDDGVVRFEHLDESANLPGLSRQKVKQPLSAANLKQDEETLRQFCRNSQSEPSIAALNMLRQEYGAGFDSGQIDQALQSGLINLGPASVEILQEAAAEHQDFLINQASPQELRQAARAESEQHRIQAQQQHVTQQIKAREQAEAGLGHPLPETDKDGNKIDRAYLLRLADTDIKRYKQWCSFYTFSVVTDRLNGVR
jgi:hypothetical protein